MALCEGAGSGANPGGDTHFSGPEEKQQTYYFVKVETAGAAPVGTAIFRTIRIPPWCKRAA